MACPPPRRRFGVHHPARSIRRWDEHGGYLSISGADRAGAVLSPLGGRFYVHQPAERGEWYADPRVAWRRAHHLARIPRVERGTMFGIPAWLVLDDLRHCLGYRRDRNDAIALAERLVRGGAA